MISYHHVLEYSIIVFYFFDFISVWSSDCSYRSGGAYGASLCLGHFLWYFSFKKLISPLQDTIFRWIQVEWGKSDRKRMRYRSLNVGGCPKKSTFFCGVFVCIWHCSLVDIIFYILIQVKSCKTNRKRARYRPRKLWTLSTVYINYIITTIIM